MFDPSKITRIVILGQSRQSVNCGSNKLERLTKGTLKRTGEVGNLGGELRMISARSMQGSMGYVIRASYVRFEKVSADNRKPFHMLLIFTSYFMLLMHIIPE